ncbi:3-methyl-2-oxobutanoate hydroxymethyltransferase [Desulfosediminicola ganghwensis]|uniref:3-methyl-2-oxobutanoate hydroxymethyltransferase n=1 Tax=Desulfosediminicola ganghwensis TaxID=2569540 RepID=UPI0010ACC990|nr:3-methyl-2-oxobutanoate hydroxymethyltransferase [Desulfosediminicola ganghwensis]
MRKNIQDFQGMKEAGIKISMLTAYDASMSSLLSECGTDMLLVGDSLGMVVLGYDSTVPVTMEQMVHHASAVRRGAADIFVVGDMPFGSYQTGSRDAINNGLKFIKESDCDAVKLEGGQEVCEVVSALVRSGISVMGHLGLTPQTASQLGGYKVQGKELPAAEKMVADARALQDAGVFAIVLECVPEELATLISKDLKIPTIGIGAGAGCDGQVLVINDMLGMFEKFTPKFVKQYAKLAPLMKQGVQEYLAEVKSGTFPAAEQGFSCATDYSSIFREEE